MQTEAFIGGTIRAAARALRTGALSARALADSVLARIDAVDGPIRAFIETWPGAARAAADTADRAGYTGSTPLLAGIPLAHKDIFARPDRQPSCGVRAADLGGPLPPSPLVARLDRCGAVDLGVLNLAEFALGTTGTNAFFGNVANPWNPAHCAGASSSGSAAAVAAALCFAAMGTDSGGSCRVPASFCGVVGLKPTHDLLATDGVFPLAWSLDCVGLLARTLDDAAILFAALQGDSHPPRVADGPALRVGIPRRYYHEHLEPDVAAAWQAAIRGLEAAGHRIVDVDVVESDEMRSLLRLIMRTEAAATHRPLLARRPDQYPLAVRKFFAAGEGLLAIDYVDALRLRGHLLKQALATTFTAADVLLTPAVPVLPPRYDRIADPADKDAWRVTTLLARCTQPASYLGLPALAVPAAVGAAGLPIGVQLIGAPHADASLFRAALPIERMFRALDRRPTLH